MDRPEEDDYFELDGVRYKRMEDGACTAFIVLWILRIAMILGMALLAKALADALARWL